MRITENCESCLDSYLREVVTYHMRPSLVFYDNYRAQVKSTVIRLRPYYFNVDEHHSLKPISSIADHPC